MHRQRGVAGSGWRRGVAARGALLAAVVVGLAGCTGDVAEEEASGGEPWGPGPFRSYVHGELGADDDALYSLDHVRRETKIAECVTAAGFEYTIATEPQTVDPFESVEEWESKLREKGWGYFTQGPGEQSTPDVTFEPTEQDDYVESLSPEARAEYERLVFGERDPSTGEPVPGQEGCLHEADFGDDPADPDKAYADLLEEVRGAWEVAEEDPAFAEVRTAWRECLSRAGFPGVQLDPNELIDERMAEEFPDMTFRSNDPRLVELAEWEVSLANAHLDCVEEVDLYAAQSRAIAKVENEIMERRSAEVEAYIAAVREELAGS